MITLPYSSPIDRSLTPVDAYGLTEAELTGCLRAFYRTRHRKLSQYQTGRRATVLVSRHRTNRSMVSHYADRIRELRSHPSC